MENVQLRASFLLKPLGKCVLNCSRLTDRKGLHKDRVFSYLFGTQMSSDLSYQLDSSLELHSKESLAYGVATVTMASGGHSPPYSLCLPLSKQRLNQRTA